MAAEAVSAEEQNQIDRAIRESKEQWLAEAAAARRRCASAPVTPAPSPSNEVVDLCSSSSDEEHEGGRCVGGGAAASATKVKAEGGRSAGDGVAATVKAEEGGAARKRKAPEQTAAAAATAAGDEDDGDCMVIERRPQVKRPATAAAPPSGAAASAASSEQGEDDDLVVEGTSGPTALVDFPHSRSNCVLNLFAPGNFANRCSNCFCYVCVRSRCPLPVRRWTPRLTLSANVPPAPCTAPQDAPASICTQWQQHCAATHADRRWREERERHKILKARGGGASSSTGAGHAAVAVASAAAAAVDNPYGGAVAQPGAGRSRGLACPRTCEELMRQVQQVWPVETPEPAGLLPSCRLRPYQKQSLAFMLELERAPSSAVTVGRAGAGESCAGVEVRGGWLCDEVGMGKTIVCIVSQSSTPC